MSGDDQLYFAYSRVSTEEQADSRNGLEAQRTAIDAEAKRRGWTVEHYADEGACCASLILHMPVSLPVRLVGA